MKKYKIIKSDGRRLGYPHFKYQIIIINPLANYPLFYKIKEWCWENWGSSKLMHDWITDYTDKDAVCQNSSWAWTIDRYTRKIYLRTDEELSYFKLVWGDE